MKKVFGLLAITAVMVSCSDDDSSSSGVSETKLTAGKWYYSTTKYAALGQSVNQDYEHECATSKDYISFANGVYTDVSHDSDCDDYTDSATYTLDGKTLTINYSGGDADVYTVKSVSASKLVLETSYTESGVTAKYTDTYTAE